MRALLLVTSLWALSAPALAQAPERALVMVTISGEPSLGRHLRAWVRALRPAVGASRVEALGSDCWPEEASCAARFVHGDGRILLVSVTWDRSGCVPVHDPSGATAGHRMLRVPTLELTLLDASGTMLAHIARPAEATAAERRAALPALLQALGLGS